jgi:hypothetical protein
MGLRALWPFAVLAVVAFLPTWQFLFGDRVPAPVDQITALPPWNNAPSESPTDILQLDGAIQFLQWREFMLVSYKRGEVPIWNDLVLGGIPFLANSQSAPLYPLHILWSLTGLSAEALLSFSAWLHLWIAGCGLFLLCRRLGGNEVGGLIGASALILSAFFIAWIQLPSVVMTASWIPWVLLGVLRLFEELNAKSIAKLALALALMLLSGHLQIAMYGLMATVLYIVWLSLSTRNSKAMLLSGLSLVFGLMIASPQLLPTLENGRNGHRAQPPTSEGYQGYSALALKPHHLSIIAAPTMFGMPGEWVDLEDGKAPSYWLPLEEQGRNYAELALYIGPVVLPLFLLGFFANWRSAQSNFYGFLALFSILAALGTVVTQAMYWLIPGWAATGSPGRIAVLFAIAVCALAGSAIGDRIQKPKLEHAVVAAIAVASLAWLAFVQIAVSPKHPMQAASQANSVPWIVLFLIGAAIALGAVLLKSERAKPLAIVCLLLAIGVPAASQWNVNPGSKKGLYKQSFEGLEELLGKFIAVVNDQWSLLGPGPKTMAPPNSLMAYGIKTIDGYDSLIPRETKAMLDEINGQDSAPLANGNMMFIKPGFNVDKLRATGVTHVASTYELDLPLEREFSGWKLYKIAAPRDLPKSAPPPPTSYSLGILLAMLGVFALFAISYRRNVDADPS